MVKVIVGKLTHFVIYDLIGFAVGIQDKDQPIVTNLMDI